jgi:hypothetical protein
MYPRLASADSAARRMTRRSRGGCAPNRFGAHWRSRVRLLGTTPACRNGLRRAGTGLPVGLHSEQAMDDIFPRCEQFLSI